MKLPLVFATLGLRLGASARNMASGMPQSLPHNSTETTPPQSRPSEQPHSSDDCNFMITAHGPASASGIIGQLDDGQNRIGGGHAAAFFSMHNHTITDKNRRGCIVAPPTTQFQCDEGTDPVSGFNIGCRSEITYHGGDAFYACPVNDNAEWNVYTQPAPSQLKCVEIKLTANLPDRCKPKCKPPKRPDPPAVPSHSSVVPISASTLMVVSTSAARTPIPIEKPTVSWKSTSAFRIPIPIEKPTVSSRSIFATSTPIPIQKPTGSSLSTFLTSTSTNGTGSSNSIPATSIPWLSLPSSGSGFTWPVNSTSVQSETKFMTLSSSEAQYSSLSGSIKSIPTSNGDESTTAFSSRTATSTASSNETPTSTSPKEAMVTSTLDTNTTTLAPSQLSSSSSASKITSTPHLPHGTPQPSGKDSDSKLQLPKLAVPLDIRSPDRVVNSGINGIICNSVCTAYLFESDPNSAGRNCSLNLFIPSIGTLEGLQTAPYRFDGIGSLSVYQLNRAVTTETTWNSMGSATLMYVADDFRPRNYQVWNGPCPSGQNATALFCADGTIDFEYFQLVEDFDYVSAGLPKTGVFLRIQSIVRADGEAPFGPLLEGLKGSD
ncbi:hypothetical protein P154DRAFT_528744 [Amniculicola lignicola CBS 123094]|uniref:Uncharacterized protein n=1 Tax=Amniculicola lignicola CBS 123094 TaxID=1392246 RepID=A0A6A5X5I9_9PLEO|nr:hypothetical protein P154DRAFT_528744 [Amniculicola lignicola CBS 123094]